MAKRSDGRRRTKRGTTTTEAPAATRTDAVEQRMLAFAEQLGRMIGTIQVKAEGWMDGATLKQQIALVRDGATDLLEQLAAAATTAARTAPKKTPRAATTRGASTGRSGGAVDAAGKKHRKRAVPDPGATIAASQAAKVRTAMTMEKTNRRRGRG
jgi:hypothetical protein